jgi:hypothetical protein
MEWIKKGAILALAVLYLTTATGCSAYKVSVGGLVIYDPGKEQVQYADSGEIKTDGSSYTADEAFLGGLIILGGVGIILLILHSFERTLDSWRDGESSHCLGPVC